MNIPEAAWPYLVLQQGRLDHLKGDREAWAAAYEAGLEQTLAEIWPWIPTGCDTVLDIGGGMGGIDALIAQRLGWAEISILDGAQTPPKVEAHGRPFNDLSVTADFLAANGVENFTPRPAEDPGPPLRYDLVLSLAAWCFHIPPAAYLDFVRGCVGPGSVLILEVRAGREDWLETLAQAFTPIGVAGVGEKFLRVVYAAR